MIWNVVFVVFAILVLAAIVLTVWFLKLGKRIFLLIPLLLLAGSVAYFAVYYTADNNFPPAQVMIASNFPSTVDSAVVEESLQKADGNYTRTDEYDTGTVQYTLRLTSEEQQNATEFFDAKPTIRGHKDQSGHEVHGHLRPAHRRSPAAHRPLPAGVLYTRRRLYLRCGHHLKRQRQQGAPLCYEKRAGRAAKIKIPLPAGISCFSIAKIRRLCKTLRQKPHQCAKNLPFTNVADRRRCDDPNFLLRNSQFFLTTSSEYANIIQQCETALPTEYRGIV